MSRPGMKTVEYLLQHGCDEAVVIAAMVRIAKELNEHRDEKALCGLLHCMWTTVAQDLKPRLEKSTDQVLVVAGGFLDCYFGQRGDWRAMERMIRADLVGAVPTIEGQLNAVLDASSEMIEKQYQKRP